jgi:hypothetical protein
MRKSVSRDRLLTALPLTSNASGNVFADLADTTAGNHIRFLDSGAADTFTTDWLQNAASQFLAGPLTNTLTLH